MGWLRRNKAERQISKAAKRAKATSTLELVNWVDQALYDIGSEVRAGVRTGDFERAAISSYALAEIVYELQLRHTPQ